MINRSSCLRGLASVLLCLVGAIAGPLSAQRTASVHGVYTYVVSDDDNVTLKDAKHRCVELAKAAAIKERFGELVTSDVIESNVETGDGKGHSSFFWENTRAMAKGDWLADERPPKVEVTYSEGKLYFRAEVWGKAREIVQGRADLTWKVLKENNGKHIESVAFNSGDRLLVSFRSPADGYVAVYLIVGDDEAFCLLPYPKDADGRFHVVAGRDYLFFDKEADTAAKQYRLTTDRQREDNQIVVIYSPNPFTKCNDVSAEAHRPHTLNTHDFQKWLLKCQRIDKDMVVEKKWVRIHTPAQKK